MKVTNIRHANAFAKGLDELGVAVAVGGEGQATGLVARMLQFYPEVLSGEHGYGFIGPLDDADSAALDVLVKAEVLDFIDLVYPIQVYVVEHQSAPMLGREDEGRTPYVCVDAESAGDPLGEAGLASAKLTDEEEEIVGHGGLAEPPPDDLGLLRGVGLYGY